MILLAALCLFGALNQALPATGQDQPNRGSRVTASVPSPRSVLGFTPGDDRTIADWKQITGYFARLARASDRILVKTVGESTLKRPLVAAFLSAPENLRNLEKYREIQERLADPRKVTSDVERDRLIIEGKTVVVISCSIHSTEIVASQMSMQLAYDLATAEDADTLEILRNTILILIPSPNPDGIDIVASWYRRTLGTRFEGREPPELYHYYAGHDDNRDWFMLNLKETKAITRLLWKEWFPEIVYDVHQQGSYGARIFVPPFYDPANPHVAPLVLREIGLIGEKMAADLTARGVHGVLTNALYDTWWHGGFRTSPCFHNSIGLLTEAASARIMTPISVARERLGQSDGRGMPNAIQAATNFPDPWLGGEWRPRDIMRMELIAARSVLSLAAKYRADYLRNFYELGRASLSPKGGEPIAYLIPAGQGHDENIARLIGALVDQGVEVYRLERELHAITGTQILLPATRGRVVTERQVATVATMEGPVPEIPAGSYLVLLNQPYHANVVDLFEPQAYPNRLSASGQPEKPYDVTGWTLPMQMGVETRAVISIKEAEGERKLTLIKDENDVRRDFGLPIRNGEKSPIESPVRAGVRIGIYHGSIGNADEGWTRFVFDTFNVPYESLRDAEVRQGKLNSRYDAIVLPSESEREIVEGNPPGTYPPEFTGGIGAVGVENLRRFVENGGTLICFDASCALAIEHFRLPLRNVVYGLNSAAFFCPGSILRVWIDSSHPLTRGLASAVDAYFINSSAFEATEAERVRVVARYAKDNVLRSGWLVGEERIKDRIALAEVSFGKGRVVLFGFRPQHRGQTWGTFPLIWNAINQASHIAK
jgi:hypothetical protein